MGMRVVEYGSMTPRYYLRPTGLHTCSLVKMREKRWIKEHVIHVFVLKCSTNLTFYKVCCIND